MKKSTLVGMSVTMLIVEVILGVFSFKVIPTGYTGVRISFGQISEETVPNGFNWKIPFVQSIKKVNNKQQDILFEDEVASETAERTTIIFKDITVTYKINPEKSAWKYTNVADYKDNLVSTELVASAIKSCSKTLEDTEATNRATIEPLAKEKVQESLDDKYGENVVIISKVVISNVGFEDTYNEKIAEKQNAQLDYEKQQIKNVKEVETAETDAKVKITEAQADANAILEESLSEEILKQRMLDKWNGELPKVISSSGSVFDVTGLLGNEEE